MKQQANQPGGAGPILLRLDDCADRKALHRRVREVFGFPAYYGANWDAMWDGLSEAFLRPEPRQILVEGLDALPEALRPCAGTIRAIFRDLQAACPWVTVSYR